MDDLRIPCILRFPGDPPPDLSGFAEPICFPVRVVWRKAATVEQSVLSEPPPLAPVAETRERSGSAMPGCASGENHRRDMSYISEIRPQAADEAQGGDRWYGEHASGVSIYAYTGNDPIDIADSSGLLAEAAANWAGNNLCLICSAEAAQHPNYPSATALAATIYNETSSLYPVPGGPGVGPLRDAIANVVLNRIDQNVAGSIASPTLSSAAYKAVFTNKVPAAVAAYQSSLAAATAALHRTGAPQSGADSALFYNNRPTDAHTPNPNYKPPAPFDATLGPYRNVAPSPQAPANSTYFAFFGHAGPAQ
jgi:hypothetical protein